jgi:hypothetical protein
MQDFEKELGKLSLIRRKLLVQSSKIMGMSFLKNFRNIDESSIEELIDKKIAIEKFQTIVYRIILFQFVLFIGFIAIGLTLDHYNNFKYYCEELLKKHSFLD